MRLNVSAVRMDKGARPTSSLIHTGFLSTLCFEPFYTIFIDPEGNAAPCNGAGRGVRGLNVTRRCLKDVWFSDHFAAVRKKMLVRKPIESCLKCGLADMTDKLRGNLAELLGK
jgi:MoaA/NifB/PqqE/SkfB family radical SAM enzyme